MNRSTSSSVEIRLGGLRCDNFLAFLALLGLLRALNAAHKNWGIRASWRGKKNNPLFPVLHLNREFFPENSSSVEEGHRIITEAALEGMCLLEPSFDFLNRKNIDYNKEEFRAIARTLDKDQDSSSISFSRAGVLSALASDVATKKDSDRIQGTQLCALYGQGGQNFLERLRKLTRQPAPDERDHILQDLKEAIFQPWVYIKEGDSFRWDPAEDRRYAHMHDNPRELKIRVIPGANRLAIHAIPFFQSAPNQKSQLETTAFFRKTATKGTTTFIKKRSVHVRWPLWDVPASIDSLRALLSHPDLTHGKATKLGSYSVVGVMEARRVQVGKYFCFGPAKNISGKKI